MTSKYETLLKNDVWISDTFSLEHQKFNDLDYRCNKISAVSTRSPKEFHQLEIFYWHNLNSCRRVCKFAKSDCLLHHLQCTTNKRQRFTIFEEWKTNLMSLAILFHLLCAQHVSDINISIFRSLRLCWRITTSSSCSVKTDVLAISVTLRFVVVCLLWCVLSPCCNW
jgi:hypothetical protein